LLENLAMLATSENPIAIVAPNILPARAKKIEAKAEKVFVVDLAQKKPARGFNSALVNALGARDGKTLWKELQKAERQGDAPEMVHALLHWKARDMMQKAKTAGSGSPDVAFRGSAGGRKLSRDLIELLSDSRGGDLPLKEALERFALSFR